MSDLVPFELTVCEPWATIDDLPATGVCRDTAAADPYLFDDALLEASDLLNRWSAFQYPGLCTDVVRPCARARSSRNVADWSHHGAAGGVVGGWSWQPSWGSCGCARPLGRPCSCNGPSEVALGRWPVVSVELVMVDGVELDPQCYEVADLRWLRRLPDVGETAQRSWPCWWPCCQRVDLPDSEPDTFSVEFTFGSPPPPSGKAAALELACEIARARAGAACNLPAEVVNVVTQGLTYSLAQPDVSGRAQLPLAVRWFLDAVNPAGQTRPAMVWSPDVGTPVTRTTWPS